MALMQPPEMTVIRELLENCEQVLKKLPEVTHVHAAKVEIGRTLAEESDPVALTRYISQQQATALAIKLAPLMAIRSDYEETETGKIYTAVVTTISNQALTEIISLLQHIGKVLNDALSGSMSAKVISDRERELRDRMAAMANYTIEPMFEKTLEQIKKGPIEPVTIGVDPASQTVVMRPRRAGKTAERDLIAKYKAHMGLHPDADVEFEEIPIEIREFLAS